MRFLNKEPKTLGEFPDSFRQARLRNGSATETRRKRRKLIEQIPRIGDADGNTDGHVTSVTDGNAKETFTESPGPTKVTHMTDGPEEMAPGHSKVTPMQNLRQAE